MIYLWYLQVRSKLRPRPPAPDTTAEHSSASSSWFFFPAKNKRPIDQIMKMWLLFNSRVEMIGCTDRRLLLPMMKKMIIFAPMKGYRETVGGKNGWTSTAPSLLSLMLYISVGCCCYIGTHTHQTTTEMKKKLRRAQKKANGRRWRGSDGGVAGGVAGASQKVELGGIGGVDHVPPPLPSTGRTTTEKCPPSLHFHFFLYSLALTFD